MQLQDQHTAASRALATVRAQAEAKERQRRIAEITLGEINAVPDDDGSKLYRGVGKMCVLGPGALLGLVRGRCPRCADSRPCRLSLWPFARPSRVVRSHMRSIEPVRYSTRSRLTRFVLATPTSVKSELRADLKSATEDAEAMRKKAKVRSSSLQSR